MAKRNSKPLLNSICKFADNDDLWCEECGKVVKANYYGIEIREIPVFLCPDCARGIAAKLTELCINL